ncbi:alginate lyase family protein [Candidatus Thioglobus sp.]|nr:alginate lyase family protein [Candidatus Thioglobus sp.]MDB9974683.1 alginate lyase family protein [Candidatus Thioglobus sp.]
MKKILFIFVILFYSIQGHASNTYDSFPFHEFAKSPLRDLKVQENWRLFKNPSELKLFHEKFKNKNREKHSYAPYFAKCEQAISEFDIEIHKSFDIDRAFFYFNCKKALSHNHYQNREKGIKVFERILLSWAKNKPVQYPDKNLSLSTHSDIAYSATMLVGDFASFYAVYYEDFNFNSRERKDVNKYLSDWLINHDIEPNATRSICVLEEPEMFEITGDAFTGNIFADYCGSNRWRMGLGAVYLGLRTSNQRLFTAGNRHIEINLAAIDKDGIFPQWARKGALALSYQRQLPEVLTLLALAYESIGYDFYKHQLPHGKKIHEVYEALFDFIYHPEKLNKYAFADWSFVGKDAYKFDKLSLGAKWAENLLNFRPLAAQSKGYILRYRPELITKTEFTEQNWRFYDLDYIALFLNLSGVAIYESANETISNKTALDAKKKKEKERLEAEKKKEEDRIKAAACEASPLNGMYEARWIRDHWRDNGEWEFVGSEPLILDQCEGEFEGIKQFDPRPTPAVRKKLIVKYQLNGEISIKGDLNLYDIDDLRYTELYGNINDGEISGVWGLGNRIKIELVKK